MATPRTSENELDLYLDRIASLRDVIVKANVELRIPIPVLIGYAARAVAADAGCSRIPSAETEA